MSFYYLLSYFFFSVLWPCSHTAIILLFRKVIDYYYYFGSCGCSFSAVMEFAFVQVFQLLKTLDPNHQHQTVVCISLVYDAYLGILQFILQSCQNCGCCLQFFFFYNTQLTSNRIQKLDIAVCPGMKWKHCSVFNFILRVDLFQSQYCDLLPL